MSALVFVLTGPIAGVAMEESQKYSIQYFASFSGYRHPLKLINKITEQEAKKHAGDAAYYMGYFDVNDKLVKIIKMFHGAVIFQHSYSYYPNGKLRRVESTNEYGKVNTEEFDESGKVMKRASSPGTAQ
jgi:hypothetical protein